MKNFSCLDRKQNIFGAKLLEASAGTGKTFSIEHLFVRLLLEAEELTIDQILVVTFTNAATRELKMRIRSNLQNALKMLSEEAISSLKWDYLVPFYQDNHAMRKLEDALFCFDSAQIFTIHSFCYRMLNEFFIEAQFSCETQFLEGNAWEQQILIDFFHFGIKNYLPEQIDVLLSKYATVEKLLSQITKTKKFQKTQSTPFVFDAIKQKISEYPKDVNAIEILEEFRAIFPEFKQAKFSGLEDQVTLCASMLDKKSCSEEEYRALLRCKLSLATFFLPENQKKKSKYDLRQLPEFFCWIQNNLFPLVQDALNVKHLLQQLAVDASSFLERRLGEEKKITPDFLLKKMDEALGKEGFLQQVQDKYRIAVIDEFQDTDALQWQIFHSLFWRHDMDAFYLVGDPKQSIYRFRGADPQTYFNAKELFGDERIFHLNTNYRSEKSLVDSLNGLFSCNTAWFSLDSEKSHLPYVPVEAASEKIADTNCLQCLIGEGRRTSARQNWPLGQMEEEKFFPFIANEIHSLIQEGHSFADIAILLKDRYQLQRLKSFLEKEQIPCVSESPWDPAQSPVLDALEHLFHVVYNPRDVCRIKTLLGTAFFQYDLTTLQTLELNESYISPFFSLKETLEEEGLASFFQQFLSTQLPKRGTVLENLSSLKDLSFFEETMAMMELYFQQERTKGFQLSHFERVLEQIRTNNAEGAKGSSDEDQVRMLTIHKSKGLEFEFVFVPGIMQRSSEEAEEAFELDEEKLRHFYVALTRAKLRAYLFFAYDTAQSKIKRGSLSAAELFVSQALRRNNPYEPVDREAFFSLFSALQEKGILSFTLLEAQEIQHSVKEKSPILIRPQEPVFTFPFASTYSFTSLAKKAEMEALGDVPEHVLPAGAQTGEVLHLILQKALSSDRSLDEIVAAESCKTSLRDYNSQLYSISRDALQVQLEKFSLSDISKKDIQVEMEFLSVFENTPHFFKGFIDLFFFHQGKYYLLDWKSNYLSQYDTPALEREMVRHDYFLQASIYADAVRRYLNRFEEGSYEKNFGGMFYVFLRGLPHDGVYFLKPDLNLIEKRKGTWDL